MKKSLLCLFAICSLPVNASFIHPQEFDGSEGQKQEALSYIQSRTEQDYCQSAQGCDADKIKALEKENLDAFIRLSKTDNKMILDNAIHAYCNVVDMCNYQMLEAVYTENIKAGS